MIRAVLVLSLSAAAFAAGPSTDTAWNVISTGTVSPNAVKRKEAVTALEAAGPLPRAVTMVEEALIDKDIEVRQAAAAVLCSVGAKRSIPKLRTAMEDPSPEVSFAAARALWCLGDYSGRDILIAVAEGDRASSSGMIKEQLRDAMKKLHNPSALAMIGLREGAGAFLGPVGIGFMVFDELRKDASASARTVSVTALAKDQDPKALDVLLDALQDKNWVVRAAAAKSLAVRGDGAAVSKLEQCYEDKQDAVRFMAAAAVIRLDSIRRAPHRNLSTPVRTPPAAAKR